MGGRMELAVATSGDRAASRLLAHCAALSASELRPSAEERLAERLGEDLARLLLFALSGRHGRRRACLPPGLRRPKTRM